MADERLGDDKSVPGSVLFACGQNTIRSPMASEITRYLFPRRIYAKSAGVHAGEMDGFAIAVMDEIGLDVARHKPMRIDDLEDTGFDLIITLAPEAHHKVLEFTRSIYVEVEYWPAEDPSIAMGNRDERLNAYRRVRNALMQRIKKRFDWRPGPAL